MKALKNHRIAARKNMHLPPLKDTHSIDIEGAEESHSVRETVPLPFVNVLMKQCPFFRPSRLSCCTVIGKHLYSSRKKSVMVESFWRQDSPQVLTERPCLARLPMVPPPSPFPPGWLGVGGGNHFVEMCMLWLTYSFRILNQLKKFN